MFTFLFIFAIWGDNLPSIPDMPSYTGSSTDYNFEVLDHWPYGSGFSVIVDGDNIFYTNGAVLQIGDLSLEGQITWVSELYLSGMAYTMFRSGNILYIAVDDQGIAIVDVTELIGPRLINQFQTAGRVFGLATRGDTVYAAMGAEGLDIYDCTDALNPGLLGTLSGFNLRSLVLDNSILYATDVSIGLLTIDVSDPASPRNIVGLDIPGWHYGLALDTMRNQVWVCSYVGGLHIVEIADTTNPSILATLSINGAWAVDVESGYAYVVSWSDSLHVIDVESLTQTASLYLGDLDITGVWPYDISIDGERGSIVGFLGSWWTLDVSGPDNPIIVDGTARGGICAEAAINESWIVLGLEGSKIAFFERAKPLIPENIISSENWPRDLILRGDTLYSSEGWSGLAIYLIDNSSADVEVLSRFSPEKVHVWGQVVDPPYVYLVCGDTGLIVVDIFDPHAPQRLAQLGFGSRALSVYSAGDSLYIGLEQGGVRVVDLLDSENPVLVYSHPTTGSVSDITKQDELLYVAQAFDGVFIYDTSQPGWPLIASIPTANVVRSITLKDDLLLTVQGSEGLLAYEIDDPSLPHLIGALNTGGDARDLIFVNDSVYIADGYDGLILSRFLGLGVREGSTLLPEVTIWPNPFSSMLYFSKPIDAGVYDAGGRLRGRVSGQLFDGSTLGSGVYFIRGNGVKLRAVKIDNSS